MKKILIILFCLMAYGQLFAQADYSGKYSYAFPPSGNPPKTEKNRGPSGQLYLLKMHDNLYRFWLDITNGWPSYHVGETDGTIQIVNDTSSFDNTFEGASDECILKFKIHQKTIKIQSSDNAFNCGFGAGVTADGEYKFDKVQPIFNNAWLRKQYYMSPTVEVIKNKVSLYKDENCHYPKPFFFKKGDRFLSIAENKDNIYTEFIDAKNNFVYGWLPKTTIKTIPEKE